MKTSKPQPGFISLILLLHCFIVAAQDSRTQYPPGLKNANFGVSIGYINYPFSSTQLEPGNNVESVSIPHTAVRILLYGYSFNKHLSARITYMRPVGWVQYRNINGDKKNHSVWMNVAGLTLNAAVPVSKKISFSAEAGLGIITRNGFETGNVQVVKNANYVSGIFGGAFQYHLGKKWDLQMSAAWSPENKKVKQPHTLFIGGGFQYHLRPLSKEKTASNALSGYIFPEEMIMAGYTSNALGYGVNDAVSKGPVPIFWGGAAHVRKGFSLSYQRNIFHARKVFAMDWAAHIGFWQSSVKEENFFSVSLNPVLRFHAIRTQPLDIFLEYSVAGPAFISKTNVDNKPLGRKFTFHDFMGMGVLTGKKKNIYAGLRIAHYSNGNLFPENEGVKIPLTLNLGYVLR